jgi:hypothetical protein
MWLIRYDMIRISSMTWYVSLDMNIYRIKVKLITIIDGPIN